MADDNARTFEDREAAVIAAIIDRPDVAAADVRAALGPCGADAVVEWAQDAVALGPLGLVHPLGDTEARPHRRHARAWERLAARGLIPLDWVQNPARAFARECARCKGTGHAPNGVGGCSACRPAWERDPRGWNPEPQPTSYELMCALAADPARVATAEALARAGLAELAPRVPHEYRKDAGAQPPAIAWRSNRTWDGWTRVLSRSLWVPTGLAPSAQHAQLAVVAYYLGVGGRNPRKVTAWDMSTPPLPHAWVELHAMGFAVASVDRDYLCLFHPAPPARAPQEPDDA